MRKRLLCLVICSMLLIVGTFSVSSDESVLLRKESGNYSYTLYSDGTLKISGSGKVLEGDDFEYAIQTGKIGDIFGFEPIHDWPLHVCNAFFENRLDYLCGYYEFHAPYEYNWQGYEDLIENIIIEDGITDIGEGAFARCNNLKSITIPKSVGYIGQFAFVKSYPENYYVEDLDSWYKIEWDDGTRHRYNPAIGSEYYDIDPVTGEWIPTKTKYLIYNSYWFTDTVNFGDGNNHIGYFNLYENGKLVKDVPDSVYLSNIAMKYCKSLYRFKDVNNESSWYYTDVNHAAENGWLVGTGIRKFEPNSPFTRAMMAQLLYNIEGASYEATGSVYEDVPADKWYSNAVEWAYSNKIMIGYSNYGINGRFNPNEPITREQAVVTLLKYAEYKGRSVEKRSDISVFPDYTDVSDYAKDSLSWAVAENIIYGSSVNDETFLLPRSYLTRAQAASVMVRYNPN